VAPDATLAVDPAPRFELSPYRYMQFMEPLGTTDASVEAGWDFERHCWREDLIEAARELAPALIRWPGGILSSYYRWREGVGPSEQRVPMLNICWGGIETNQIGTHEFIDFCRRAGAEPLIAVNFESDGNPRWSHPASGEVRSAGPEEAAAWVAYCNHAPNAARIAHGAAAPFNVRLWQIGNETSYSAQGYDCESAALRTLAFARAMRRADPAIELIGWGDSGWARRMLEVAGEELQAIAFHHHFDSGLDDSPLRWNDYRRDPAATWEHLMNARRSTQTRIRQMRDEIAGFDVSLALTESHFSLPGRNRCDVLATWAAGVANARVLNVHARNGDLLKIATLADFCGTRWMVNALMIPTPQHPRARTYLMPVARVMSLYRRHEGRHALDVTAAPGELDVTASRTGERIYLHAVNTGRTRAVRARLQVDGFEIVSGRAFEIAADPLAEIDQGSPDLLNPVERALRGTNWTFPAASVTAIELHVQERSAANQA
jgi:alpha-N-arabinofuranosidase